MAAAALKSLVVNPVKKHTATVIFVHGLGDSGLGWQSAAEMLGEAPNLQHIKWVLPHAPVIPITVNMGMKMPGWFDIFDLGWNPRDMDKVEDEKGMMTTMHSLNALITTEIDAGTPASRILLGGFSQGGAMTVATGLTTERKLAGLAVLSGWAPMRKTLKSMLSDHFKQIPIFWGHGTRDPIVRYDVGKASEAWLDSVGVKKAAASGDVGLDFHAYEGVEHSTSQEELADLQNFIAKVLPEST